MLPFLSCSSKFCKFSIGASKACSMGPRRPYQMRYYYIGGQAALWNLDGTLQFVKLSLAVLSTSVRSAALAGNYFG